ncbi:hypothetical protein EAW94_21860 [Salmonella enterica]|nr:hypothetical protein [Salmonella enterica]
MNKTYRLWRRRAAVWLNTLGGVRLPIGIALLLLLTRTGYCGIWASPIGDWKYSFTASGGIVQAPFLNNCSNYDLHYGSIGVGFDGNMCNAPTLVGDIATFNCINNHTVTVSPVQGIKKNYSGYYFAGYLNGAGCAGIGKNVTFNVNGSDLTAIGLVLYFHNWANSDTTARIITPASISTCSGSLTKTTLTWKNILTGATLPRQTIPYTYKCTGGGGQVIVDLTESSTAGAPLLQYDFGGSAITNNSYTFSCSAACQKSIDFGVSGKTAATTPGKYSYVVQVTSYQP